MPSVSFIEWLQGRIAGKLEVAAATRVKRRGDEESVKHPHLSLCAGNQRGGGMKLPIGLAHNELTDAFKEGPSVSSSTSTSYLVSFALDLISFKGAFTEAGSLDIPGS